MVNFRKKKVSDLQLSDSLMVFENGIYINDKIDQIQINSERVNVYKIEVAEAHTYITKNLIWHHNYKAAP